MIYPDISNKLTLMAKNDQAARQKFDNEEATDKQAVWREIQQIDAENTNSLKQIVDEIGLPTISKVGSEGASCAWLLVQHAGEDNLEFMRQYLLMMEQNVDQIAPGDYARLYDRVQMYENKPQRYGTQFIEKDGKTTPHPIEDMENINRRRAEVGLNTFEEGKREIGAR